MSAGLFDNTDGGAPPAAATEQVAGRRTKLFPWDSVATQLFEPHGESALDAMSLKQIWEAAMKGNKKAAYHSHLCADKTTDAWHVGAGISLTAASLLAAIKHFRNPDIKKIIVPELYAKVENELQALEPKLQLLNLGKGSQSQKDTGSFRAAKRLKATGAGTEGALATEDDVMEAAKFFYKWLAQPKSAFRSMLFLLAGSNTYYSAHCADVVARAGLHHKPMSEVDFVAAMTARLQRAPEPATASTAGGSDATGLFDL